MLKRSLATLLASSIPLRVIERSKAIRTARATRPPGLKHFTTTTGGGNTANGFQALRSNETGDYNTADGLYALGNLTSGFNNTALGRGAGFSVTTADYVICIGASGANVSHSCYIDEIWQQPGGSQAVYVNADGKLGALVSSRHFKDEIKPMEHASEVISAQPGELPL